MMRICVYCASSPKINQVYFDETEALAKEFVKNDVEIVFGGGSTGLMGKLADTMLAGNGRISGIMPEFMHEVEWGHKGVKDFIYTETMAERKQLLIENVDAVVTLPGGTGTYEELFEVMSLKKLGQFSKPIIILNTNDYFEPLRQMLQKAIDENFMLEKHSEVYDFVDKPEDVIPKIKSAVNFEGRGIDFAKH